MKLATRRCEGCGSDFQPVSGRHRFCSAECIPHGTKAGYEAHKRTDKTPCDICRHANAIYTREWRNKNRDRQERLNAAQKARERAMRKLVRRYPGTFLELYDAELAAMGGSDE